MQELIQSTYNEVKPKVILVSKPDLRLGIKDLISYLDKRCIIYKFNCFCERSYTRQTSRHLKMKVDEQIPRCILMFTKKRL